MIFADVVPRENMHAVPSWMVIFMWTPLVIAVVIGAWMRYARRKRRG